MKITVLVENSAPEGLTAEWGLSMLIEYRGKQYLLDAGSSDVFLENARNMGVSLETVDAAILSHAHYDHSGGLDAFCELNGKAPIYIRREAAENCYSWHRRFPKYIGVQRGVLKKRDERLVRVEGKHAVGDGIWLLPHSVGNLKQRGKSAEMYVRRGLWLFPDEFRHEQSLVFEMGDNLVIFSSCSHSGVDYILDEVSQNFPSKKIIAMVGGFHLVRTPPREVRLLAERLRKLGVPRLYTGHCTGDQALEILQEEFPGFVHRMETGMCFEIGNE